MFLLVALAMPTVFGGFVHPGLLHTEADFTRMKQKVAAQASPWIDSWNILINSSYAQLSYTPHPVAIAQRGSDCNPDNSDNLYHDTNAAYQLALIWKISGNTSYADKAIDILNKWASTLTQITCINGTSNDYAIMAGAQGYQFANAAEIMRNYSGWAAADFNAFKQMMLNVFLPVNIQFHGSLTMNANWDMGSYLSIMSIGVLCDNQTLFNQAVDYFYNGRYNGAIAQSVYYVHPGYLGQMQESGRDQSHNTYDITLVEAIAETAWSQGVDLYGFSNNRILAGAEYQAKGNLIQSGSTYYTVPFVTYTAFSPSLQNYTVFSSNSIGYIRPTWVGIYNHYVNRLGMAAPYTLKMIKYIGAQGGGGQYGSTFDLGFETLTKSLDNIASGISPSGLTGVLQNGSVVLSWWGTYQATSYQVKRSTSSSGPFTTIANVTDPLSYTDSSVGAKPYYYVVSATTPSGATDNSNVAQVIANPQAYNTLFGFNQTSGSVAVDSSGNGNNGTLVGGAKFATGIKGKAVSLNGTSQYVSLPASIIYNLSDFTIASWIKINTNVNAARLFDFGFGTGRYMYFVPMGNNGNAGFCITSSFYIQKWCLNASDPLPSGQWNHVAITLLGMTGTYYVNGTAVASGSIYQQPYQIAQGMSLAAQNYIGRSQYSNDPYLNALVDEFQIYQGALTADQVAALASS